MIPGFGRTGFGRDEIYPDPMKSPSLPISLPFSHEITILTFHHHFTQINGFDFKIQGVYSKDIPPSHQQNSHCSQQQTNEGL